MLKLYLFIDLYIYLYQSMYQYLSNCTVEIANYYLGTLQTDRPTDRQTHRQSLKKCTSSLKIKSIRKQYICYSSLGKIVKFFVLKKLSYLFYISFSFTFVIRGGKNILPYLPNCQEPETLEKKYQEPEPLGKKSRATKKLAGSSSLIG